MTREPQLASRRRSRRGAAARDQQESAFAEILLDLIQRVPGARTAALVDRQGETVDYAGLAPPFETRLAAAHWRIVLDTVREQRALATMHSLVVRAARASFIVQALPEGYALVLALARGAGFRGWQRAVPACAGRLRAEAGWLAVRPAAWFAVDVACDERGRPRALRGEPSRRADGTAGTAETTLEVLGRLSTDLSPHERAWRVRLSSGTEAMLVCESGAFWYTDEPPRAQANSTRPSRESL
jgi:hypothetical protein